MSKQFADISTRREYILGLTEVICQIFEISGPDRREAIILELEGLDDEALIEKQEYIEEYFESNKQVFQAFQYQARNLGNSIDEEIERKGVESRQSFIFN